MQWVLQKQAGMSCSQVRMNPHQCQSLHPRRCQTSSLLPDRSDPAQLVYSCRSEGMLAVALRSQRCAGCIM